MLLKELWEEAKILLCHPVNIIHRMRLKYHGVKYGRRFMVTGRLKLKIRGRGANIIIGDDFSCLGDLDLRNRENGRIIIGNKVYFDHQIRLVAANDGTLSIGEGTSIASYFVCNAGVDMSVGKNCMFSGFVFINCSDHQMKKGVNICEQPYIHGEIKIGDDVFLGAHVYVMRGTVINNGAVVGANSVVNKDVPENAIAIGVPARIVGYRE